MRRALCSPADVHLSVGADMTRHLEWAGCGEDISHWGTGVDTAVFSPARRDGGGGAGGLRWQLTGGRPEAPIALYCGRVAPEKNLALLPRVAEETLRALAAAAAGGAQRQPPLAFVVVGAGPFLGALKALMAGVGPTFELVVAEEGGAPAARGEGAGGGAAPSRAGSASRKRRPRAAAAAPAAAGGGSPPRLSLAPLSAKPGRSAGALTTVFAGQLAHGPLLGALYASADAFFSPSECETLGQVFQEAQAAGTLPVGAAAGGVPEVVAPGADGYLFDCGDARGAAAGLLAAFGDRAVAEGRRGGHLAAAAGGASGAAARQRVLDTSWELANKTAIAAYWRALATRIHVGPVDVYGRARQRPSPVRRRGAEM
jgi:glycosyltransferase involved in cell wall biosynthesis